MKGRDTSPLRPNEQRAIERLTAEGWSVNRIAEHLGRSWRKVAGFLDPDYAKDENARRAARMREQRRDGPKILRSPPEEDAAARLALIPKDTRDLTARAFGDPVFERSALYRKQHGRDA